MSTPLEDILAMDAVAFVDPNLMPGAELVTYTPLGGTARPISAVVDRNPPARIDANGNVVTPKMTISVANHATAGISSASLNAYGNDKVTVAYRIGDTAQDFGVYLPDPSAGQFVDAGMITLDLR